MQQTSNSYGQEALDISKISNPSQLSFSFNSLGKLNRAKNGSSLNTKSYPRRISNDENDQQQKTSESNSLNDRASSHLDRITPVDA